MKRVCIVFSKYSMLNYLIKIALLGPLVYFILQIGLHVWMYEKILNNIEIIRYLNIKNSPATGITLILYFIMRFKN